MLDQFSLGFIVFGALVVLTAYTVFGATGFGAGIISIPAFAHFLPLGFVVPMICIMDLLASFWTGWRNWKQVDKAELFPLIPFMLLGMAVGTALLLYTKPLWMLAALGFFIAGYGAYNLFVKLGGVHWTRFQANVLASFGGIFSASFGSGGPVYSVLYTGRMKDMSAVRASTATTIGVAVILRAITYAIGGLFLQPGLLPLVAVFIVFAAIGLVLGTKIHQKVPRDTMLKGLSVFLLLNGISLIYKGLS